MNMIRQTGRELYKYRFDQMKQEHDHMIRKRIRGDMNMIRQTWIGQ